MKYMQCAYVLVIFFYFLSCKSSKKEKSTSSKIHKEKISSIKILNNTIDFGLIKKDTVLFADFYIKNTGLNNLIIKDIKPECTCTGYTLGKDTISPGDSTMITVEFNTQSKTGLQRIATIVKTNTEKEFNTLFIKVIIRR